MSDINSSSQQNRTTKSKLTTYATVAGTMLATSAALSSNAQIIYTDIDPDVVYSDFGFYEIDMDNDGTADMQINMISTFMFVSGFATGLDSNYVFANTSSWVSKFSYGSMISGTSPMKGPGVLGAFSFGTFGYFLGEANSYIGVKFKIGADYYNGWVQVSLNQTASEIIIHDYAYESYLGYGIEAGRTIATGIEQRNSEANVYAFGRDINVMLGRAATTGKISVYDMTGKRVHQSNLSKGNNRINVKGSKGIYVVKITSNGRTTTQKVHLD
ncbi:MAG: T9SS type A sorting domain-containing protein [Flavobacteriales bacterium]|nr:T9SS type A sorting domain-containing protein [Flavobacteriales bacterium]